MTVPLSLSSVPAVLPYIQYVATGGQTVYPYPFPITQDADLVVVINGVTQPTDSGYTLSGQGNATGGNVTLNSGSTGGDIITLFRNVTIQRLTQIGQNSGFSSAAFNAEFNNIYLILQQLQESISLSLQIPNTNNPVPTVSLTPGSYANKYMAFDAFGNPTPALLSSTTMTAAVIGGLITPQTGAEAAANMVVTFPQYLPYDVRRYNVRGDGVTDDTGAWNAIGAAAWNKNITLTTPSGGFNSKITGTVTLPGPYIALMMDPSSKFTYVDPGTWNTPALVIGSDSQAITGRDFCIGSIIASGNTYASESCVGIQIRGAFNTNRVRLCYAQGFTVNWQIHGTGTNGVAYNTFDLGSSFDAIYHLDIHSFVANAFINENLFLNGQIQISSGYSASRVSYGIVFRAEVGAYQGQNKNHFVKPSIQISQAAVSAERIPIWFNNAGGQNQIQNARFEGLNGEVVRVTADAYAVQGNLVDIGYVSTSAGTVGAYLTETDGGLSYNNHISYLGQPFSSTWDSGDLVQKVWAPSAGNISVLGMFMQAGASGTEVTTNTGKIGKDCVLVTSGGLGVYVDTTFFKEFELRADTLVGRGGRPTFVAYDVNGAVISTTRAVQFGGLSENANYGGHSYTASADSTGFLPFRVDSTVKTLKVMLAAGTNACALRRFTLTGFTTQNPLTASINLGLSAYGGPFAPQEFISTAIPTALGGNFTQRGFVAWNGNAAAGNTVAAGWICTAAGWNAPAWVLTTAYILNQMVNNDTGKVYVCRVAGTSAGSGGPTGTGTGIVDNTVTWDYVVNGTPEPVGTNATWTALANVP